jgi:septum formation protein
MRILKLLNGRRQSVYTGVALSALGGRLILSEAAESRAFARKLDDEQLKRLAGKHLDKAGSYAVQDKEDPFIARIEGDLDNIIGLPMRSVRRLWKKTLQALALGEAGKTK